MRTVKSGGQALVRGAELARKGPIIAAMYTMGFSQKLRDFRRFKKIFRKKYTRLREFE